MDYCNIDSEIIDSLDYLRPPVKRNINYSRERIFGTHFNRQPDVIWHLENISTNHETKKVYHDRVESSTSLILKKTSEIGILNKYPIVSHTDFVNQKTKDKDKPLIKVTVIPKRDESQTKFIKKRKPVKKVHSAVSNQENSIKTKNVYFVVAGRRKEKVYEIKTTGSAQLSNDHVDCCFKEVKKPLERLSNYKEFIDSLNMDKKRKKNKKKKQKRDFQIDDNIQDDGDMCHECQYTEAARDNVGRNIRSPRSRVTIFGRVGVTEDERYVINCAATVNNEPVPLTSPTGFNLLPFNVDNNQEKQKIPADNKSFGYMNECMTDIYDSCKVSNEYKRDSNIQADFPDDNTYYKLMDKNTIHNKESQGTQVNFNINLSNVDSRKFQNKEHRYDLCNCDHDSNLPDSRNKINNLKDCRSPLVIISVYPKKDSDTAHTIICPSGGNTHHSLLQRSHENTGCGQNMNDSNNAKKIDDSKNRNANKSLRISRSPSPVTRNLSKTKLEGNKQLNVRLPRANVRKVSPDRRLTNVNQKIQRNSTNQKCLAGKTIFNAHETKGKKLNYQGAAMTYNFNTISRDTKGTNTENLMAKKILVENYSKNIALQMIRNGTAAFPKTSVSNVKINIDGDNDDDYNVLLYQDNCTTDLNFRKTVKKEKGSQRYSGERTTDSMQNLLQTTRGESRKWPLLQDLYNEQSKDDWPITSRMSRLNLRDSLEIGHRRDDKNTKTIKETQTSENSKVKIFNSNDMKFLAPIKHYAGDKCSVPDPLVRDKEIRELLGIEKCRATTSKAQDTQARHRNNEQVPLQCFYNEERNRDPFEDEIDMEYRCRCRKKKSKTNKHGQRPRVMTKSTFTQYEPAAIERTSLYQQMILNRNVQVFLQVEQFTKQKPIILSRKQYNKVKRTIQNTISKTQERRRSSSICKTSIISVGEVRKKGKPNIQSSHNKKTQTKPKDISTCFPEEIKPSRTIGVATSKQLVTPHLELSTVDSHNEPHDVSASSQEQTKDNNGNGNIPIRKTVSSVELCYASVAYFNHVRFSSTNIESLLTLPNIAPRNSCSIQTIFKGRRKSPTPNLGTSGFSLFSEMGDSRSVKVLMPPRESKPKKPFLRRLMSCLVMRSMRASEVKMGALPPQDQSVDSTIDSYHISTSLGAIELSSSIYDTSASFYSNHSILPNSNKMKRGFLNSVRGYLTNRKS